MLTIRDRVMQPIFTVLKSSYHFNDTTRVSAEIGLRTGRRVDPLHGRSDVVAVVGSQRCSERLVHASGELRSESIFTILQATAQLIDHRVGRFWVEEILFVTRLAVSLAARQDAVV